MASAQMTVGEPDSPTRDDDPLSLLHLEDPILSSYQSELETPAVPVKEVAQLDTALPAAYEQFEGVLSVRGESPYFRRAMPSVEVMRRNAAPRIPMEESLLIELAQAGTAARRS